MHERSTNFLWKILVHHFVCKPKCSYIRCHKIWQIPMCYHFAIEMLYSRLLVLFLTWRGQWHFGPVRVEMQVPPFRHTLLSQDCDPKLAVSTCKKESNHSDKTRKVFKDASQQLFNLWWMPNSVSNGFDTAMKTGSSRRFKRYPTTYVWVSSWLPVTED